ncbi:hypothetical protein ACFQX7_11580 [Luedemannella flava]
MAPEDAEPNDRNPWYLLLLIPVVVPMLVFIYNDNEPRLFGFPGSTGCSWRSSRSASW